MAFILTFCGAFIAGLIAGQLICNRSSAGKLHIVRDEDNQSYMFLELDVSVDKVVSEKYVTFKVTQK